MKPADRIIVNTAAQYVRAIFNTCLALFSTRLILEAVGVSDYGIYSLIAGIVSLLGFITTALMITTQRYVSYYHGQGNHQAVKRIFVNSIFLHLIAGICIGILLLSIKGWLINDVLTIDKARIGAASYVYSMTVVILLLTIVTTPFKALLIAHENIVYISFIEIIDSVVKLLLAIWLIYVDADKLMFYVNIMVIIYVLDFLAFSLYDRTKYPESKHLRWQDINKQDIRQIFGFAGWTTYGAGVVVMRNQGIAIILNHFLGTMINAAYGIANQVYGALTFVGASVMNAMNPQVIQAGGAHNRDKMLYLAGQESKFSTALLSIVCLPIIVEMPAVLNFWLKEVPAETCMFCRLILLSFICDQLTIGLNAANQAIGKIRNFTLLSFTPKLLILPIAWYILRENGAPLYVMSAYLMIELLVALFRIPYLKFTAGLSLRNYCRQVLFPLFPLMLMSVGVSLACVFWLNIPYRFVATLVLAGGAGLCVAWFTTLTANERLFVKQTFNKWRYAKD